MGIAFDVEKMHEEHISVPLQERRKVEGRRKLVDAVEHLNNAIDDLIIAEEKLEEAGLQFDKDTARLFRRRIVNTKNDLARASML